MDDEHDRVSPPPRLRPVATRFEVAAPRLADAWLRAGRIEVSRADLDPALEYLARLGVQVRSPEAILLSVEHPDGRLEELTREQVMLLAFRQLVDATLRRQTRWPRDDR
jgi:hypothetical protein